MISCLYIVADPLFFLQKGKDVHRQLQCQLIRLPPTGYEPGIASIGTTRQD